MPFSEHDLSMNQLWKQKNMLRSLFFFLVIVFLVGCDFRSTNQFMGKGFEFSTAALSPNGNQIAMTVTDHKGGNGRIFFYDIRRDSIRAVPTMDDKWNPEQLSFSNDQKSLAVQLICLKGCGDNQVYIHLSTVDIRTGIWRKVVTGGNYRGSPTFSFEDKSLVYMGGEISSRIRGRGPPLNPTPIIADIKSGYEHNISLGENTFFAILYPQIVSDSELYFLGIEPRNVKLLDKISTLDSPPDSYSALLYRLSFTRSGKKVISSETPELVYEISNIGKKHGLGQFRISRDGRQVFISTSESIGGGRIQELIYRFVDLKPRLIARTDINILKFSVSGDGRKIMLLGDPLRRGSAAAQWDFFMLDVESGKISPLSLLDRINDLL